MMWFWNILGWILGILIIVPLCLHILIWLLGLFKATPKILKEISYLLLVVSPFLSIIGGIICIIYAFIVEEDRTRGLLIRGGIICCLIIPGLIGQIIKGINNKKKGAN